MRGQDLSHHEIRILGILERHVPALDLTTETDGKFGCFPKFDGAVRQLHGHGGQVRPAGLPIFPPMPFQHATIGGRRSLLELPSVAVASERRLVFLQRGLAESLGTKQFTSLRPGGPPATRRAAAAIGFELRRQAQVLIPAALQQVAG